MNTRQSASLFTILVITRGCSRLTRTVVVIIHLAKARQTVAGVPKCFRYSVACQQRKRECDVFSLSHIPTCFASFLPLYLSSLLQSMNRNDDDSDSEVSYRGLDTSCRASYLVCGKQGNYKLQLHEKKRKNQKWI